MTRPLLADYYVPNLSLRPAPAVASQVAHHRSPADRARRDAAQRRTDAAKWAARNYAPAPSLPPEMAADLRMLLALVGQALAEHDRRRR